MARPSTGRVGLEKIGLVAREAVASAQFAAHHLTGALLLRFPTRSLPDSYHRRHSRIDEALNGILHVVLKSGPAELTVGEHRDPDASLVLQGV